MQEPKSLEKGDVRMKGKTTRLVGSLVVGISAVILISAALSAVTAAPASTSVEFWGDEFDWDWTWVREDPTHWSLTARPGSMVITSTQGSLGWTSNNAQNVLLRDAPATDFVIETHVHFEPTENFQFAGLVVYDNDDNFMQLGRAYCGVGGSCVGNGIYFDHEEQGTNVGSNYAMATTLLNEAYLRIVRNDDVLTGYYSENGTNWTMVGSHTIVSGMVPSRIGLIVVDGDQGATEIPAEFEYFRATDDLAPFATDFEWGWSWVREDPTHWSLTDDPGYMKITLQQGGLGPANNNKNLLIHDAPVGDFEIETHVYFTPTENFQFAGLLLYDDDDNYMMLGRAYCAAPSPICEGNGIYFDHEELGNVVGSNYVMTTTLLGEAYLGIIRDGSVYTGYVSENGTDWTMVGAHTAVSGMVPSYVGLIVADGNQGATQIPAKFDYFRLDDYAIPGTEDFFDDFDLGWGWIREDPTHWSLSERPDSLVITSQLGGILGPTNTAKNMMVVGAPYGDFSLETRVFFTPTEEFQIAGLLVYENDDNFLMLGRAYCTAARPDCVGNGIYFDREVQGAWDGINYAMTTTLTGEAYLRIVRGGDTYTGFVSNNGLAWTLVGVHTGIMPRYVGLAAHDSDTGATEIPAQFDYFVLVNAPGDWVDDFDWDWNWIREDPTYWSLTDRPGFMHITSQQGGLFQSTNNAKNLLLHSAPGGNLQVDTHVYFTPTENFHGAGLLLYEDDDNYLFLGRAYCDASPPTCYGNGIYFDHEEQGNIVGSNYATTTTSLSEAYLRIRRDGSVYTGFVSENGVNWTTVGAHTAVSGFVPWGIGLASQDGGIGATEIPADFDYFRMWYLVQHVYLPLTLRNY
jgi:beta-xylosidase